MNELKETDSSKRTYYEDMEASMEAVWRKWESKEEGSNEKVSDRHECLI